MKRRILLIFFGLLVLFSSVIAAIPFNSAQAIGETYTLVKANNPPGFNITATGGAYGSQTVPFNFWETDPSVPTAYIFNALVNNLSPTLTHCVLEIYYNVDQNNKNAPGTFGLVTSAKTANSGNPDPLGPDYTKCNPDTASQLLTGTLKASNNANGFPITPSNPNSIVPTSPLNTGGNSSSGGCSSKGSKCICESSGSSLSWLICALVNDLVNAENAIEQHILIPLLQTPSIDTTSGDSDSTHTFAVWSNFRLYGDVLLVVGLIAAIIAESVGGGTIEAYTVRKMLPRLLIAAILINLSLYIVAGMVDITNVIGKGIESLILLPFQNAGQNVLQIHLNGTTSGVTLLTVFGAGAALWGGGLAGIGFIALTVLLPLGLAFLGVILTLFIRKGLILFLIYISPIAFALYVLPNTEQYFRRWWKILFETLLIYPLIGVLFAMATVLGVVVNATSQGGGFGLFGQLLSIVALIIPLFLIPYSFRLAGGILGAVHEQAVNYRQRAHGAIAGDAKNPASLRNRLKARSQLSREGRFLSAGAVGTALNPTGGRLSSRKNALMARREAQRLRLGAQYAETDALIQANKNNDKFLTAYANRKVANENLQQALTDSKSTDANTAAQGRASAAAWQQAIAAAGLVHKDKAVQQQAAQMWAATGYNFAPGERGYNQLAETMIDTLGISRSDVDADYDSEGNITKFRGVGGSMAGTFAQAMNSAQYSLRGAGQFHLGGINNGAGYDARGGFDRASGYTAGNAKKDDWVSGAEAFLGATISPDGKTAGNNDGARGSETALRDEILRGLESGKVNANDVVQWHNNLLAASQSPTFKNDPEIQKQISAINALNTGPTPTDERVLNTVTDIVGRTRANTARSRRGIDPNIIESGGGGASGAGPGP